MTGNQSWHIPCNITYQPFDQKCIKTCLLPIFPIKRFITSWWVYLIITAQTFFIMMKPIRFKSSWNRAAPKCSTLGLTPRTGVQERILSKLKTSLVYFYYLSTIKGLALSKNQPVQIASLWAWRDCLSLVRKKATQRSLSNLYHGLRWQDSNQGYPVRSLRRTGSRRRPHALYFFQFSQFSQ